MRHRMLRGAMIVIGLAALGCVPRGGGGGGGDDDDGGGPPVGDGMLDAPDIFVDPDDGVPPPDMFVDPDDGVPPPDMAPDPDDGVPPPDGDIPKTDAAPPECEPLPEVCNDLDDDCDGTIDEDFDDLGQACAVGVGPCQRAGDVVCSGDGEGTVCGVEPGAPMDEQCNGEDDDCDDAVDEIPLCEALAAPECTRAIPIDDPERNIEQPNLNRCDTAGNTNLPLGEWIRFVPPAGERLPEEPPDSNTCGTDAPGWLESGHPAVEDGVVEGTACFHYFDDPCNWMSEIEVRNCGDFYVYRLTAAPICRLQYCVE